MDLTARGLGSPQPYELVDESLKEIHIAPRDKHDYMLRSLVVGLPMKLQGHSP